MTTPAELIAPAEAARMMSVSVSTLAKYRREGSIKFVQYSSQKILYDRAVIAQFIADHSSNGDRP